MYSKELVGASVRPILLTILSKEESYGYEIIQKVKGYSLGKLVWKDGSLYPVLHKMEDEGVIESFWSETDSGRRRKYYRISALGKSQLEVEKSQWIDVNALLMRLWGIQPGPAVVSGGRS